MMTAVIYSAVEKSIISRRKHNIANVQMDLWKKFVAMFSTLRLMSLHMRLDPSDVGFVMHLNGKAYFMCGILYKKYVLVDRNLLILKEIMY